MQVLKIVESAIEIMDTNVNEHSENFENKLILTNVSVYFTIKLVKALYFLLKARLMELLYLTHIYNESLLIPGKNDIYVWYSHFPAMSYCSILYEQFYSYYDYIIVIDKVHTKNQKKALLIRPDLSLLLQRYSQHFYVFRSKLTFELCPIYRMDILERSFALFLYKQLKRDLEIWLLKIGFNVHIDINKNKTKKKGKNNKDFNSINNNFVFTKIKVKRLKLKKKNTNLKPILSDDSDSNLEDDEIKKFHIRNSAWNSITIPQRHQTNEDHEPDENVDFLSTELLFFNESNVKENIHLKLDANNNNILSSNIWPCPDVSNVLQIIEICKNRISVFERWNVLQPGSIKIQEANFNHLFYTELEKNKGLQKIYMNHLDEENTYLIDEWNSLLVSSKNIFLGHYSWT